MPPLLYHRSAAIAAAHPNRIRIVNLPHCKLRLINMMNGTDACLMSVAILKKNAPIGSAETLSLFFRQQSLAAETDVGWEGDIDLGHDQDLVALYEDTPGIAPTAADLLFITIGYEPLW